MGDSYGNSNFPGEKEHNRLACIRIYKHEWQCDGKVESHRGFFDCHDRINVLDVPRHTEVVCIDVPSVSDL
jgi:hypothetical protein